MKLKTYIIPDFKTIEIRSDRYCDGGAIIEVSNRNVNGTGTGTGNTQQPDSALTGEAAIFRDGIWDEE